MNNAVLYEKSNKLQRRDALQCLEEFEMKINWNNDDRILDIGCGDGGVMTGILKKFIPGIYSRLVGCDISAEMVRFANEHHSDARTSFFEMDIEGHIPDSMKGNFDHAFSFYTMHWITDQERAFSNIYSLLAAGGDTMHVFLGHTPLYDIFRGLARRPRWRPWVHHVERFISPYHDSKDPVKKVKKIMAKAGFKNICVECRNTNYDYGSVDEFKKAMSAVSPFDIPEHLHEEYMEDFLDIMREISHTKEDNNNIDDPVKISAHYTLIVAFGTK